MLLKLTPGETFDEKFDTKAKFCLILMKILSNKGNFRVIKKKFKRKFTFDRN